MGFTNPVTSLEHVDTVGSVQDPVTAGGGHVDTVGAVSDPVSISGGTVDSVSNPVTVDGGSIDSITGGVEVTGGTVGTVSNPVTVDGGSVDHVKNAVEVAGGTVDSVSAGVTVVGGTVDEVINVSGTVGTVEIVTESVPQQGRDLFYWPAISGESFPPTKTNYSYGNASGQPCYTETGFASGAITFPHNPRLAPGKTMVVITSLLWLDYYAANYFPSRNHVLTILCAGVSIAVTTGSWVAPNIPIVQATCAGVTAVGSAVDTAHTFVTLSLTMNKDGSGSLRVGSGAVQNLPAGTFPLSTGDGITSITVAAPVGGTSNIGATEIVYA